VPSPFLPLELGPAGCSSPIGPELETLSKGEERKVFFFFLCRGGSSIMAFMGLQKGFSSYILCCCNQHDKYGNI